METILRASGDSSGGGDSESDGSYDDSSGSEDYGDDSSGDSVQGIIMMRIPAVMIRMIHTK